MKQFTTGVNRIWKMEKVSKPFISEEARKCQTGFFLAWISWLLFDFVKLWSFLVFPWAFVKNIFHFPPLIWKKLSLLAKISNIRIAWDLQLFKDLTICCHLQAAQNETRYSWDHEQNIGSWPGLVRIAAIMPK